MANNHSPEVMSVYDSLSNYPDIQLKFDTYIKANQSYYDGVDSGVELTNEVFDALHQELLTEDKILLTHLLTSGIWSDGSIRLIRSSGATSASEMISLNKIIHDPQSPNQTIQEIIKFFDRKKLSEVTLYIAPKLDGAAGKVDFDSRGSITLVKSRGGVDITEKFKRKPEVRDAVKYRRYSVAFEILMPKRTFESKYANQYSNPRNFVGKLIKQSSVEQSIIDDLVCVPYSDGTNPILDSGLWHKINNLNDIFAFYEKLKADDYPYLCDGIVLAYETQTREVKNNYPMNMVAVKFPGATIQTTIVDYYFTQKKSGNLTPMAVLAPVKLEGINISLSSAYNMQYVIDNNLGIGAVVEVTRSGDITPNIIRTVKPSNNFKYPDVPYKMDGKHAIALESETSDVFKFVSAIKILAIPDIGTVYAQMLADLLDNDILAIFNPDNKPAICSTIGTTKYGKFTSVIHSMRTIYLDTLIHLLQFDGVGPVLAKRCAMLITKQSDDATNISADVLRDVCSGDGLKRIQLAISTLKVYGIAVLRPINVSDDIITYEMTQEPEGMTKAQFVAKMKEKYPNAVHAPLTKTTSYLFCSDTSNNTGKVNKARKYNIPIVKYSDALTTTLTNHETKK